MERGGIPHHAVDTRLKSPQEGGRSSVKRSRAGPRTASHELSPALRGGGAGGAVPEKQRLPGVALWMRYRTYETEH